ncbi:YjdF family protein [Paenibacillus pabuli]|uniref:YjdF family protein n=1 Tax=Paenibacillus pabuli TaxID=1472 RepID=UPI0007808A95|nr:YjdF family protein [Paenibacillus pabuli]MEC0127633.1 YjdF family protein [Paenibacillus pabuli]
MKLTVYFDGQFWLGVLEDERCTRVCRYVFGKEPKDEEVLEFIRDRALPLLENVNPVADNTTNEQQRRINPKRMIRLAAKQMKGRGAGTKAEEVMRLELELRKKERKTRTKEVREREAELQRELRVAKAKRKHRGK